MNAKDIIANAKDRMEKAVLSSQNEMATLRSGKVNPNMLDRIVVDYYGSPTPLKQMANIAVQDGSCLVIQPYDKTSLANIEKAIAKSELGLTPNNDGDNIRISVPPLSKERRKELCKILSKMGEEGKVAIRNVRRDAMDDIKKLDKEDGVSEDDVRGYQDDIQKETDSFVKKIDTLVSAKEVEIMEV